MYLYKQTFLLIFMLSSINFAQKAELIKSEFIFQNPPFKSCHASTIVELENNKLMAAWFGGSHEGAKDVCIWRSFCNEGVWEKPIKAADGIIDSVTQYPCWNPVLFQNKKWKIIFVL